MAELRLGPINAATPTPIAADGTLDRDSAKKLCRRWIDIGLDGVLLLGSMGEGPYLPDDVRTAFVQLALEEIGSRLTLFVSAADVSRERMKRRAREYARMGAPCVVLCLPPNTPAARAVSDVKAVADSCPAPCAYYDIPANTGVPLVLNEIRDILGHGNIVAFKDSSGNDLIAQGLTSGGFRPGNVRLLDGNEYRTAYSAALGYDGVLHGGGALTGKWVRAIWDDARAGNLRAALESDREKALFLAAVYNRFSRPLQNTVGQKYALTLLGCMNREDVVIDQSLDEASRNRIRAAVESHLSRIR